MTNTTWNLEPPPGFQGLREDLPLTVYYRHLPHWRQDGATYFVTFRLVDSLPQEKLRELDGIKREWLARHGMRPARKGYKLDLRRESFSRGEWEEYTRIVVEKVERWLDRGMGECWLRNPELAAIVVDDLHYGDSDHYELGCYVAMPNHVHAIIRPLDPSEAPLEAILHGCKRHSSRQINIKVDRTGALWQEESFDRIIRDEEHLWNCIQYIARNPRNAKLKDDEYRLWIRPDWEKRGWRFVYP